MIPTRPIKTFKSWMLHNVELTNPMGSWELTSKLESSGFIKTVGFDRDSEIIGTPGYFIATMTMGSNQHHLYFGSEEDANRAMCIVGGVYNLLPHSKSPLRNTAIFGNYTLKDMMDTFGDPLPNKLKYFLIEMQNRGIDYFHSYGYMHQDWAKHAWWPEAFIYHSSIVDRDMNDILRWLRASGMTHDVDYDIHMRFYEFRNANDAMLFKLAFGEDQLEAILLKDLDQKWNRHINKLHTTNRGF